MCDLLGSVKKDKALSQISVFSTTVVKKEEHKTGVINDPLGQSTVPIGNEDLFCFGRF